MRTYGARFDVNCSILFTELPLTARAAAAAACGFRGVEFWWPWPEAVPSAAEADAFVGSIVDAGVQLVALNFHAGDLARGERGILSHPARAAEFRRNIPACVEIARRTGCTRLNAPYGRRLAGVDHDTQDAVAIANLRLAAEAAGSVGASVLVEAINSVDAPEFPVDTSARAMAVIGAVEAPNVRFLADMYHLAKMGEDVADTLHRYRDAIAHVQLADPPGRGAPGTGTLGFEPLFAQLAVDGYAGWVGLEYAPSDASASAGSFEWLRGSLTAPAGLTHVAGPRLAGRTAGERPCCGAAALDDLPRRPLAGRPRCQGRAAGRGAPTPGSCRRPRNR